MRNFAFVAGMFLALAGCTAKPDPGRRATAAGILFAASHSAADSLSSMPESGDRAAAFVRALDARKSVV